VSNLLQHTVKQLTCLSASAPGPCHGRPLPKSLKHECHSLHLLCV
jgi:hypothetical protein